MICLGGVTQLRGTLARACGPYGFATQRAGEAKGRAAGYASHDRVQCQGMARHGRQCHIAREGGLSEISGGVPREIFDPLVDFRPGAMSGFRGDFRSRTLGGCFPSVNRTPNPNMGLSIPAFSRSIECAPLSSLHRTSPVATVARATLLPSTVHGVRARGVA